MKDGIISEKDRNRLDYVEGFSYKKMRPIREKIQNAGYDGVIYPNWFEFRPGDETRTIFDDSFIIFNPNQVKSATNNIGEFSPLDDDIRFSMAQNSVDNAEQKADNSKEAKFFRSYLTEEEMQEIKSEIEKGIGESVDLSKVGDLVEYDKAREKLLFIRKEKFRFNQLEKQFGKDSTELDAPSVILEYARRCFENDPRIKREVDKNVDADRRQRGVYPTDNADFRREQEQSRANGGRRGTGTATPVSHEYGNSKDHFKKLWDNFDETKAKPKVSETTKHSEKNQGAFSFDEKVAAALKKDPTRKILFENLGGKFVNGKLQASAEVKKKIESILDGEGNLKKSIAWHGSPHDFENFSLDAIGTGEGAQIHGWGLYFAGDRKVSEGYRAMLNRLEGRSAEIEWDDKTFQKKIDYMAGDFFWADTENEEPAEPHVDIAFSALELKNGNQIEAIDYLEEKESELRDKYEDEDGNLIKEFEDEKDEIFLSYVTDALEVLRYDEIGFKSAGGKLFKVDIPDSYQMLDEQKTFKEQNLKTQRAIRKIFKERGINLSGNMTGRKIYETISKTFDEDIHKGSIHASKLLNSYGVKGITYVGGRDGRCYVVFDDKAIKILEKFSLQGAVDTSIKNFVADEDLTSQQKLLKDFGEKMGVSVIHFDNKNADFHGAYSDGIVFLNKNSKIPLRKVFWHEILHWLKANNPKLFKNLADAANLSENQLKNYLDETSRKDLKDNAEITEEILADSLHKLLDKVHDKNLLQKIIAWIQDTLSKFKEMFHNQKGGLKTVQYTRLANTFSNMAEKLTDEDGNKIFRFNSRTKKLELADGTSLDKISFDENNEKISEHQDEKISQQNDTATVAENFGGRLENGEWIFDNEKNKRDFEKFLQSAENNFEGVKFSVQNFFNNAAKTLAKKLHLKGEKIITEEMERKTFEEESKKAMDDFIADPSEKNKKRLKELNITPSRLNAYRKGLDYEPEIGFSDYHFGSPSKIAEKNPIFRYFFRRGDAAMDLLVRKRDNYSRKLNSVWELVSDKKSMDDLHDLLIWGDMNEIEYGKLTDAEKNSIPQKNYNQLYEQARIKKIIDETGVDENVAKAYLKVRNLLRAVRLQLDKARRRPTKHSRHLTDAEIKKLRENKFVTDIEVTDKIDNGKKLVNYTEFANHNETYEKISQSALDKMKSDPAIQVISAKEVGEVNGEKIFNVKTREGIPEINDRIGYLPHCFHEYMIRVKNSDGEIVDSYGYGGVIGSGRTQREAIKFAEEWQETNTLKDGEYIYIAPKVANFGKLGMNEEDYAPIMGDKDFFKMVENIAENNEMKFKDAKKCRS